MLFLYFHSSRNRWAATHGRFMAMKAGKVPPAGMIVANEDFFDEDPQADVLPRANPEALGLMQTGKVVGNAQFRPTVKGPLDPEEAAYRKYDTMPPTADVEDRAVADPLGHAADTYDAARLGLDDGEFPVVRKKIVRTVEVPVTRTVKVPIKLKGGVESAFHTVQETYTDFEERPAVRDVEVWVKKVVKERYMKQVPVSKTRTARVPVADGRAYEVVPEAEADAYRVDEVHDVERVQVEEWADFELRPTLRSRPVPVAVQYPPDAAPGTTYGAGSGRVGAREVRDIVSKGDPLLRTVALTDCRQPQPYVPEPCRAVGANIVAAPPKARAKARTPAATRDFGTRSTRVTAKLPSIARNTQRAPKPVLPPAHTQPLSQTQTGPRVGTNMGVADFLRISSVANNEKRCIVVSNVSSSPAAEMGLQIRDCITHVNNRPVRTPEQFTQMLNATDGSIVLDIIRGAIRSKITIPYGKLPKRF
jgi:hypothetical protein